MFATTSEQPTVHGDHGVPFELQLIPRSSTTLRGSLHIHSPTTSCVYRIRVSDPNMSILFSRSFGTVNPHDEEKITVTISLKASGANSGGNQAASERASQDSTRQFLEDSQQKQSEGDAAAAAAAGGQALSLPPTLRLRVQFLTGLPSFELNEAATACAAKNRGVIDALFKKHPKEVVPHNITLVVKQPPAELLLSASSVPRVPSTTSVAAPSMSPLHQHRESSPTTAVPPRTSSNAETSPSLSAPTNVQESNREGASGGSVGGGWLRPWLCGLALGFLIGYGLRHFVDKQLSKPSVDVVVPEPPAAAAAATTLS